MTEWELELLKELSEKKNKYDECNYWGFIREVVEIIQREIKIYDNDIFKNYTVGTDIISLTYSLLKEKGIK